MNDLNMSTSYDATTIEKGWYERWEAAGLFAPSGDDGKEAYVVTIPPPNITGSLHMGHALCYPIQDMLGRYWRLQGKNVLILPGQDHAGIATQSVVEKQLRKEGSSGAQIGREKFVERVWKWREESGGTILNQLRALGCAFDWSRQRFTFDEAYIDAVLKVFIDWFEQGLIFRGKRVVNWDPALRTSVSDIETERKTIRGKLYYIRYPFKDGSGSVTIATTRPETMLADVAVAVHPSDKRYTGLVGKTLILPLMGREIPLIADVYPDREFGSGAVKITPAHDANDYLVGVRHSLPMPVALDERARVTELGGPYAGLDRLEARKRIVADLEAAGALEKIEDRDIPILVSERSGEAIEPLLSEQWFVDQPALAKAAMDVVESGQVKFFPPRYERIFLEWMDNIREWCVSRQLWWGHRIPIYYDDAGTAYAALNEQDAQVKAGEHKIVRQEEDVLDTWFSSGLWPFATLGWPDESSEDLKRFFPTSALVTDRNIINLWVSRMIMMSLSMTGEIPFSEVFIYATVLTDDGRRMSKSLGTGVDPQGVIDTAGADALRYALLSQTGANQDIRYGERRVEEARRFCNKIWNATRFVLMNLDEGIPQRPSDLDPVDRWLLSRLSATEQTVREAYERYDLQVATQALHTFFWSELCDWYIEVSKPRLTDPAQRSTPQWVLVTAIGAFLTMLHPVMPHITEELYTHLPLPDKSPFLMAGSWPVGLSAFADAKTEARIARTFEATRGVRALRAELGLAAMKPIPQAFFEGDLMGGEEIVRSQAWVGELIRGKPEAKHVSTTVEGIDFHLPIHGLLDVDAEMDRLSRDEAKVKAELDKLTLRLANPMFSEKAKPEVVERERAMRDELSEKLDKIRQRARLLGD